MIEVNVKQPVKIIVIGNGFDIALGLKTKYSNFIDDDLFKRLCGFEGSDLPVNGLPKHLERATTIQNWVDVENEIKAYAHTLSQIYREPYTMYSAHTESVSRDFYTAIKVGYKPEESSRSSVAYYVNRFMDEYKILKNNFFKYLEISCRVGGDYQLPKSVHDEQNKSPFDHAFTLNYTDTISTINAENKFWIHGKLKDGSAILGIDDVSDLLPQFIPILKSTHSAYGKVNLSDAMQSAAEVHFFGLSFGDTDNAHFGPAFKSFASQQFYTPEMQRGVQSSWNEPIRQNVNWFFIHTMKKCIAIH